MEDPKVRFDGFFFFLHLSQSNSFYSEKMWELCKLFIKLYNILLFPGIDPYHVGEIIHEKPLSS